MTAAIQIVTKKPVRSSRKANVTNLKEKWSQKCSWEMTIIRKPKVYKFNKANLSLEENIWCVKQQRLMIPQFFYDY